MRPLALVCALVVPAAVAACQLPVRTTPALRLVGGTIIDVTGQHPPLRADIVIDGSRIAEIIPDARHTVSNAHTVDISGTFVIPGLCDMLWRLTRGDRPLICVAKYLPYAQGVDLRLLEADGSFRRTQLCKDGRAADELAGDWKLALVRTGWSE